LTSTKIYGDAMLIQNKHSFFISRRNILLAMIIHPLLINRFISDNTNVATSTLSMKYEGEFVILGGWVLLKKDLIEVPG